MRRSLIVLVVLASACTGVSDELSGLQDRVSQVGDQAREVRDRAQFCLAVTRALASVDGGSSPSEAQTAAEEVLAQVPDELRADAQLVAERLRQAAEDGDRSVLDDEFRAAGDRLYADTRALCDPTD